MHALVAAKTAVFSFSDTWKVQAQRHSPDKQWNVTGQLVNDH